MTRQALSKRIMKRMTHEERQHYLMLGVYANRIPGGKWALKTDYNEHSGTPQYKTVHRQELIEFRKLMRTRYS